MSVVTSEDQPFRFMRLTLQRSKAFCLNRMGVGQKWFLDSKQSHDPFSNPPCAYESTNIFNLQIKHERMILKYSSAQNSSRLRNLKAPILIAKFLDLNHPDLAQSSVGDSSLPPRSNVHNALNCLATQDFEDYCILCDFDVAWSFAYSSGERGVACK